MTPTRIGFSTSNTSWVSAVIRWFTHGKVSHCFIVYYDEEWKRDMRLESEGGMGGCVKISTFNPDNKSIVKMFIPKCSIEVGMAKMVDHLGEVYDYKGLLGMAWVELGRWLKKKWKNPWANPSRMWCSELIARVMLDSSYPGAETLVADPEVVDPEQLYEFFLKEEGS